ncbi:hypothetical protein B2J86_15055 [Acidovorax sp. SRB_14]|uniref:hypothetical protein n=1 Tax=Acidovorax sp. SRB_14 TaxID=1962699 RepID=UPI001469A7CE|nr:hypothetical protein [Acidovorax sp. SRB_14]NMM82231.1 hypothetical protein [Acidovorax sp. SRB_14]NMM85409.1 hypothetical protein [Rhodococcus sp. SRB_17]
MLDIGLHQGTSLHSHTPQAELRLAVVASQGGNAHALETLWQVCAQLQRLGHPVVVLDGTAQESDDAPGLQHLLACAPWGDDALPHTGMDAGSLAVLPAMTGLDMLAFEARPLDAPLRALQPLFRQYALVVLHAPVGTLASPLLTGTAVTPLLTMQAGPAGVVDSYRQLKLLALHAGLPATVACLVPSHDSDLQRHGHDAVNAVRQCAARHLGQSVATTVVQAGHAPDMQRLALHLLENACTLGAPEDCAWPQAAPAAGHPLFSFQSH